MAFDAPMISSSNTAERAVIIPPLFTAARAYLGGCRILVTGAVGMGKSAVLEKLCRVVRGRGFKPIRLAPSGVAAVNIKGGTLHRWFWITMGQNFPQYNSHAIREPFAV